MKSIREEEQPTLLLMAAGAVAGAAAGLYLGRRYKSFDAFMADVRDRLSDLRTLWYDDELAAAERGARIAEVVDEFEDEDEPDELEDDEFEEDDELEDEEDFDGPYAGVDDDEDDDFEEDDEDFDDEVDELEEELAAVTAANGAPSSAKAADKARKLEERVLDALHDDRILSERAIEIAVVGDGVVELTGTVHAIEEVSRASAMVRNVAGVSMVLNRIDVRAGGSLDTASVPREPVQAPGDDDRPSANG